MNTDPEDILIEAVTRRLPDITGFEVLELPESQDVECFSQMLCNKAWWCYQFAIEKCHSPIIEKKEFVRDFIFSWCVYFITAANIKIGKYQNLKNIDENIPPVLWTCHFPEYPLLAAVLRPHDYKVIVKRISPWLEKDAKRCILLDDPSVAFKIISTLKNNGIILGMCDYAYATTRNQYVDFLNIPSRTPFGLFEIAFRLDLEVGFVYMDFKTLEPRLLRYYPANYGTPMELVKKFMNDFSNLIIRYPQKWLLWPTLNHRWTMQI